MTQAKPRGRPKGSGKGKSVSPSKVGAPKKKVRLASPAKVDPTAPALAADREAWDQQPAEDSVEYGFFRLWRDRTHRHLVEFAEEIGESTSRLRRISALRRWDERCRLWDAHVNTRIDREVEQRKVRMAHQHLTLAGQMQQLASIELGKRIRDALSNPTALLSARDAADLIDKSVKIDRLTHGEATDVVEKKQTPSEAKRDFLAAFERFAQAREQTKPVDGIPSKVGASDEK